MSPSPAARAVKYVNYAIALLLVVALAITYWFAWRPLPQRSGTIEARLSAPATASFDDRGVPHIRAASQEDALFLQGYVTAQDRLFQMDLLRRYTAGELAEVFGTAALDSDRETRRLRLRRIGEEAYQHLPPADRADLAAYTRGVNQYIATHLGNLPLEFTLAGYHPLPWSVVDCLLVALNMFRSLTTTWRDEIARQEMLTAGNREKVEYLFPVRSGAEPRPGSNAWALSGRLTASGKPLLSNDIHLEYSLPGIWYMTHLQAPGLDVAGVSIPGMPGVIAGHNQRIAWGITNLQFDVQDLYVEDVDERTGRYQYRGQPEQGRVEREIIRVKGRPPAEVTVLVTRHGPITISDGKGLMALRWVVGLPGILEYPILEMNRAQNWQQFTSALARFPGPGSNFVYADVDGNIGYHAAGKLPVRRGYAGDVPAAGASGNADWDGLIPFDQLPSAFNPPGGIIVSANQNPFPGDYPYPVNGDFSPGYRAVQIRNRLASRTGWRAEELLAVQNDVYSGLGVFLAAQVTAAYQKRQARSPGLDAAAALLKEWNGQVIRDAAAPMLAELIFQHIRTALAESAAPGKGVVYRFRMAPAAVEKLLRERPPGWFDDYDGMLLTAFADAVEEGSRMQGRDVRRWQYGRYFRIRLDHPVIHELPLVGKYFDIGPVPMSGSEVTVKQATRLLAPSMRMNADLADWDRTLLNIQTGQSGQILSRHYRDQWDDYYTGRSRAMPFRNVKAEGTLNFVPRGR